MQRNHRQGYVTGTREELIEDLRDSAIGWEHFGKEKLRDQCLKAAADLEQGSLSVNAGHTRYVVE